MHSRRWPRPVLIAAVALAAALAVGGCVAMPSAGPVQSYPVTQGPNAQAQPYVQIVSGPPRPGWDPKEIVEGFLIASASFGDNEQVARQYLTQQAREEWDPAWAAVVYKNGPNVSAPVYSPTPKPTAKATAKATSKATDTATGAAKGKAAPQPQTATVTISGSVQANLTSAGKFAKYAVASSSTEPPNLTSVELVKEPGGQWRISQPPSELLLTADSFANDYQLRNLYFFDPENRYLVPDPVYVPVQATPAVLMDGLVNFLIKPPGDWLAIGGATSTAFPAGTTLIGDVTLDGVTAVVNLGGAIARASNTVMAQVSGQLLRTLIGSGQGGQAVQSIEVLKNGKPWAPNGNPIQTRTKYEPPSGSSDKFYYLSGGLVFSQTGAHGKPAEIARIGTQFNQIAVSPDGRYLAAETASGNLYTGPIGGKLARRSGTGYTSLSWDLDDDLWATQDTQVVVLLPGGHLVPVTGGGDVTALAVAPDGVRVAMVVGDELLDFGAISWQQGSRQGALSARIETSLFNVQSLLTFESVTWYGPDDVITLASPGTSPLVTEYPVNGGSSTPIPTVPGMQTVSASYGSALISGLSDGHMVADLSLKGAWEPLPSAGTSPVYPG